jgi:UDP-N-acetylmuramoyl-tripeptide--D-alanyl-D-alanine ligase
MTLAPLWTSADAAEATHGHATGSWAATGISIDTRTLEAGDLFVALAGPNFDGHKFVPAAFEAGAVAAVVSKKNSDTLNGNPGLIVADTLEAIRDLAFIARSRSVAKVTAITGSVGKTGTKEALAHVLSRQGDVSYSRSSLNNPWGVPLSVARMPAEADYGVFEIGMNHAGEITPLVALARPDVAIVTAIAPAHMEFFNSVEEIARAKAEIFSGLEGGTAIINRDTEFFDLLAQCASESGASGVVSFGRHAGADMRLMECISDASGNNIEARWKDRQLAFRVDQPGVHWAHNSLAVLASVIAMGGNLEKATGDLSTLPPLPGRGAVHVIPWGDGNIRLIDDSYNANPESMAAALKTLGHMEPDGGRRIAILGDMLELGDISAASHAGLRDHVEENTIDMVFLVGSEMSALSGALEGSRLGAIANTSEALMPQILATLQAGDVVTVKASNGIGLGRIVDALINPQTIPRAANGN